MNKAGFTLIELIVGMTISMLLMMSVWVFVSTWMSNIILQKKVIDDNKKLSSDFLYLQKTFNNSQKYIKETNSWVLIKKNKYFDIWWYSYIWVKEFDKEYCWTWEITKTEHLFVSNFIPYEEIWEDINSNFWETLTWKIIEISWIEYYSDILNHQIIDKNTGDVKIWKNIFWNEFSEKSVWTGVFLNSPTWLIKIGDKLVFSDTLNNRILYLSGWLVYKLLDEKDWLNEPTWLAYDITWKKIFIANSGSWEILQFSSKNYSDNPELNINFNPENNISNINNLEINIENTNKVLTWPTNILDFIFTNISKNINSDYIELENNKIKYYFLNNYTTNITRPECFWKNSWDLIHNFPTNSIKCTNNTGSWTLANYRNLSFNSWTNYNIKISDTKITPLLEDSKHFYSELNLFDWNILKNTNKFSYYTKWDSDIFTLDDNILKILINWLKYPTWIKISWNNLLINEFETRKQKKLDLSTLNLSDNLNLTAFSENNFENYKTDFIFNNPVNKLNIKYNVWTKLLNLKIDYYKYLNCFNIDEKIERSFLLKKNYK